MAIDKSRTSPFVKGVIIFFAIMLVLGIAGSAIVPLLEAIFSPAPATSTGTTPAGSADTSSTIAAANTRYSAETKATDAELAKAPGSYDLLVKQAQAYHDWAGTIAAADKGVSGADRPLWLLAVDFYKRAIAVKPGDPNVATDMSIAQFYSNDTTSALVTAEAVVKADPTFAPVHFNMAVFYSFSNDTAKAIAEYETYIKLAPTGELVAEAKTRIASLKAQPAQTTTP